MSGGAAQENAEIDVNTIRKANLRRLIAEAPSQAEFAAKVGVNSDYLSTVLSPNGKRNPGDQLMRRVEAHLGLDKGSLDFPDEHATNVALVVSELPPEAQLEIVKFIEYQVSMSTELMAGERAASYTAAFARLKSDLEQRKKG